MTWLHYVEKDTLAGLEVLLSQQDHRQHPLFMLQIYSVVHIAIVLWHRFCLSSPQMYRGLNFHFSYYI